MSPITSHILDLTLGKPAAAVQVLLERKSHTSGWQVVGEGLSDTDGRIKDLVGHGEVFLPGHYRLTFETGPYFLLRGVESFFPQVTIAFTVKDAAQHYHVPLLLSPYGYSTYRGS
jgi:5-hydroxyisourate hydrolase